MKKQFLFALLASLLIGTAGCGTESSGSSSLVIASDVEFGKEDYQKIVSPNNELGMKVLSEVKADKQGNKFISPTSLFMALSMVYNGADGKTKEEMAAVLEAAGIEAAELNKANASLMTMLKSESDKIELDVANSIWLNDNFQFQQEFAEANQDYFNATIEEIDITDDASAERINNWVKEATNDKISKMIEPPLSPAIVAILMNAIYFKGEWQYQFDENETVNRPFQLTDGSTKEVPLMRLEEELAYLENDEFQAVSLPYGDGEMSMHVFLPAESSSLMEFEKLMTQENWNHWQAQFTKQEGIVMLPKFQLEYEAVLNDPLKALGMPTAFDETAAEFPEITQDTETKFISEVKQKTFIDVNEEGTEAVAATSVSVETESASAGFSLIVDRPFFLTIVDNETGAILFMGSITEPPAVE